VYSGNKVCVTITTAVVFIIVGHDYKASPTNLITIVVVTVTVDLNTYAISSLYPVTLLGCPTFADIGVLTIVSDCRVNAHHKAAKATVARFIAPIREGSLKILNIIVHRS